MCSNFENLLIAMICQWLNIFKITMAACFHIYVIATFTQTFTSSRRMLLVHFAVSKHLFVIIRIVYYFLHMLSIHCVANVVSKLNLH